MTTKEDFITLVNAHPNLTATGCGIDQSYKPGTPEYQNRWTSERALLFRLYPQFQHCVKWITENSKKVIPKRSSYALKAQVEYDLLQNGVRDHYIPQGAFIVAALSLGYQIDRLDQGGPNVFLRLPVVQTT